MNKYLSSLLLKLKIQLIRLPIHILREIRGFPIKSTVLVSPDIFVGGQFGYGKLSQLLDWGITGIISMRTRYPKQLDKDSRIDFLNLPVRDREAPTINQFKKGIAFIEQQLSQEGKVYIHCHWGQGRGPSMAAAYFVSQGMTVEDALGLIKEVRPYAIVTKGQRERLDEFEQIFTSG